MGNRVTQLEKLVQLIGTVSSYVCAMLRFVYGSNCIEVKYSTIYVCVSRGVIKERYLF